MKIELLCPACTCRFAAPPETSSDEILQRMIDDGPWYVLGEGETFEDMIFTSLTRHGAIRCPDCGTEVSVSEESLGRMAMEVLSGW